MIGADSILRWTTNHEFTVNETRALVLALSNHEPSILSQASGLEDARQMLIALSEEYGITDGEEAVADVVAGFLSDIETWQKEHRSDGLPDYWQFADSEVARLEHPSECGCVLPEQSCEACRATARLASNVSVLRGEGAEYWEARI